jgi:hypothetical protein
MVRPADHGRAHPTPAIARVPVGWRHKPLRRHHPRKWLVEAESPEAVDALVKQDPFWPTGLRRSVRILGWSQVFADGSRRI